MKVAYFYVEQACQIHGVLGHCLRYSTDWSHPPFPFFPDRLGESSGQTQFAEWSYRTYVEPG